jgi:hypothetical protein
MGAHHPRRRIDCGILLVPGKQVHALRRNARQTDATPGPPQFPAQPISRDRHGAIIETVVMEELEIGGEMPETLFNPYSASGTHHPNIPPHSKLRGVAYVGWVERSDTHRLLVVWNLMGIATLHPSYKIPRCMQRGI